MNGVSTPLAAVPAAVLRSHPDITRAVFELPPVGPVFEEFVAAHGLTGRLTFHGGAYGARRLRVQVEARHLVGGCTAGHATR